MNNEFKRRLFATYYDTPARVVYGSEDLHIEADGWWPGLLEGDLTGYYLLVYPTLKGQRKDWEMDEMLDIFRSHGVATPFLGREIEQLINEGYIKLR